jgi:uncharacterized membrane protein YozB (DUF420 family)
VSWVYDLPPVTAALNLISALCLGTAYGLVRRRRIVLHRLCMLTALCCSALFLACYLIYHAVVGTVRFGGDAPVRAVYLGVLGTHTILAAAVPVLLGLTLLAARREQHARHRLLGRVTLGTWLYVSLTGVALYLLLRPYYPAA